MSRRERKARAVAAAGEGQLSAAFDRFRGRHLALTLRELMTELGPVSVRVDDAESPLTWLARRKGRDGSTLIDSVQLDAGERLRADFTFAQLMPRTTSNWNAAVADGRRGAAGAGAMTDAVVAARQRVRRALDAVGPEFAGVLLDVCCFLKGLEQVEQDRRWPSRSAKVVLQLALDSLARHYGLRRELRGRTRPALQSWLAEGAEFTVGALTNEDAESAYPVRPRPRSSRGKLQRRPARQS